jgi:hypothetical protein
MRCRSTAPVERLLELVTDPGLETAVLCGHGEQIGELVGQLADDGLLVDEPLVWAKGSTWVLDTTDGRVVGARYLTPLRLKDLAGHYQVRPGWRGPPRASRAMQSDLVAMPGPPSARAPFSGG